MFTILVLFALCACSLAAPAVVVDEKRVPQVQIIDSGHEKNEDGSYSFHFRGEDGSFREETAVVRNPGTEDEFLEVNGSYSYVDANGKEVVVHYKADDHGFVPEGGNIPVQISVAAKQVSELVEIQPTEQKKQKKPKN